MDFIIANGIIPIVRRGGSGREGKIRVIRVKFYGMGIMSYTDFY